MSDVTKELESLRALSRSELVARYVELHGKPPRQKNRPWLWRRCAWRIQEMRYGGLSQTAKSRLEELISQIDLPLPDRARTVSGALNGNAKADEPPVGTVLTRTWKDREIRTTRVEGGWEFDGEVFRSLSAVAKAVTKAKWNGKLFFGLTERKRLKS